MNGVYSVLFCFALLFAWLAGIVGGGEEGSILEIIVNEDYFPPIESNSGYFSALFRPFQYLRWQVRIRAISENVVDLDPPLRH